MSYNCLKACEMLAVGTLFGQNSLFVCSTGLSKFTLNNVPLSHHFVRCFCCVICKLSKAVENKYSKVNKMIQESQERYLIASPSVLDVKTPIRNKLKIKWENCKMYVGVLWTM